MGKLEGKVALVTGSGRNIGRATVLKLAGEGAHVVVNARSNQQEAETVAREARDMGVKAVPILADVGKKARGRGTGRQGAVRIRSGRHPYQQRCDLAA
jgi:NAD(P)-dependent dehydrogenase (short-subunit alcohol dehydrogenase family)